MRSILFSILIVLAAATFATAEQSDTPWRMIPLIENGRVAPDWKMVGFGEFVVEGDRLRTECDERGLGLLVYAKEKLGDCQIRIVYRPKDARSNSGVYVRIDDGILDWVGKDSIAVDRDDNGNLSPEMLKRMQEASEKEQAAWYAVHHGYEVQIIERGDSLHRTGAIYSYAAAEQAPAKPFDEWRTMTITLDGTTIRVEQDGKPLSSLDTARKDLPERKAWHEPKREHERPTTGYLGLQSHDPGDVVYFKEVSVRPLSK